MGSENKQKHLEFIQAVITRMAGNLFYLKGWAITIITALFAIATSNTHGNYVFIAYLVLIMFWVLDGFFLSQERLFRALYNDVRKFEEKDIDFSMNRDKYKTDPKNSWVCSTFSPTLLCFYVPLIIIMLLITYSIN